MMRDTFTEQARAESAIWSLDPGAPREEWVKVATAAKAAGLDFDTFHDWSAGAGNYTDEGDCRSVWRSIREDGGIGPGTLFFMARAAGWQEEKESPACLPQLRQVESKPAAPTKPPLHDANAIWAACEPASAGHEYIARKLGLPDGVRIYRGPLGIAGQSCDGAMVLPAFTLAGELASLQFVTSQGKKVFLPGLRLPGDAYLIIGGPIRNGRPLYLVEGIGQAWSAHQASSAPAVVACGWGRVAGVADAIKAAHPGAKLVVVPDAGKEEQAAAVARRVGGAWVEMPTGSPGNYDLNDLHREQGLQAVAALLAQVKTPPQRFPLMGPQELARLPPVRWLVKGVLPQDGIAAAYGPPASGKSFLVLDLLAKVAAGAPWFGYRTRQAPVVYVALEGEAGIAQRLKAWSMKNGTLPPALRVITAPLDIRSASDRAELVDAIQSAGMAGGVLAIDTLNRAAPGADENDSSDMGEIIAASKALQASLGGLVLLVHHSGKDATKGLRGHSSLLAALDASLEVSRSDDRREWKVGKSKDGEDGKAHAFRLGVVELGADEDGEPITSCYVGMEEDAGEAVKRVKVPAGGNQRLVWDALGGLFRAAGCVAPEGAPESLPAGRPCLRLDDAINQAKGRLPCDSDRQTERTRQAITGLISKGLLAHENGFVWCK